MADANNSAEGQDKGSGTGWSSWLKWVPTSLDALITAEKKLLAGLKTAYTGSYVSIGKVVGDEENKIWTIQLNPEKEGSPSATPLVLIHGMAAACGFWCLNLDELAKHRKVYAIDLLGYGHSSRPEFSPDGVTAEEEYVATIEAWRKAVGLEEKFILLGHSFGGYLASGYALRHPTKLTHLVLCDPWGFPNLVQSGTRTVRVPWYIKAVAKIAEPFLPLSGMRAAGPLGPVILQTVRPDLINKFEACCSDRKQISDYIYHCNAQKPTGESAFHSLNTSLGWAVNPMLPRLSKLDSKRLPITMIYGEKSWIDCNSGYVLKRTLFDNYVDVQVIARAGHHVYADRAGEFNSAVNTLCGRVDKGGEFKTSPPDDYDPTTHGDPYDDIIKTITYVTDTQKKDSPET